MPTSVEEHSTEPLAKSVSPSIEMPVEQAIQARLHSGGKALVPFFTAGFPNDARFVDALRQAADADPTSSKSACPFPTPSPTDR